MKKLLILFTITFLFYSCQKEQGCTDSEATNYNADAEEDDGSCNYSFIGLWDVTDLTVDGISLLSFQSGSIYITNYTVHFFSTGNYSMTMEYNNGQSGNSSGSWTLLGDDILSLYNGAYEDFTITKLNGSEMELFGANVDGSQVIYKLSR